MAETTLNDIVGKQASSLSKHLEELGLSPEGYYDGSLHINMPGSREDLTRSQPRVKTAAEAAQERWGFEKFDPVHRGLSGELKPGRGTFWPIGYREVPPPAARIESEWATPQLLKDFLVMVEGSRHPLSAVEAFKGFVGPFGASIGAGITRHALDNLLTGAKVDLSLLGMNVPPKRYFSSILTLGDRGISTYHPSKDIRIGIFDSQKGGAMVAVAEGELHKMGTWAAKEAKGDVLKIGWVRPLDKNETDILNKIGIKSTRDVEKVQQPGHHGRLPIGGRELLQMTRKTQTQLPSMGGIAGFRVSGARKHHARERMDEERGSAPFGGERGFQAVKRTGETPKEAFTRVWKETADPTNRFSIKREAARQAAKEATGTYEKLPMIDHLTNRVLANLEKLDIHDLKQIAKMSQSFRDRIVAEVNKNPDLLQRIGRASKKEQDRRSSWDDTADVSIPTPETPQTAESFAALMSRW